LIQIGNIRSNILPALPDSVKRKLDEKLSYELPGAFFAARWSPWASRRQLFAPAGQSFPTGLLHYVEEVLIATGVQYTRTDLRIRPMLGPELPLHNFTLRDYQQDAVDKAVLKQRGIIKIGTGGGKTNVLTGIVARLNIPTVIFIHKTDIFYQIIRRLEEALQIPIGKVGDGHCEIEKITVAMIQTTSRIYDTKKKKSKKLDPDDTIILTKAEQIRRMIEDAECVITDECHHVPSDTFWNVHKRAKNAYYKFGLSASPWREDNADMLIEAAHAKKIVDLPSSILIERGFLVPPTVYLYQFSHIKRDRKDDTYPDVYDIDVVDNSLRNQIIVQAAVKAAGEGKTVLIAITKVEHGRILEAMLQHIDPTALFVFGESESQVRQQVLTELDQHKRRIVICTTIFGEGIDVPGLDVLINAKASASSVDAFQLIGRVLRKTPTKTRAFIVDIFDRNCKYLGAHANAREKIYLTEAKYTQIKVNSLDQMEFK